MVREFDFDVLLDVPVLPQQLPVVVLEVVAELLERLDQAVEAIAVIRDLTLLPLGLWLEGELRLKVIVR